MKNKLQYIKLRSIDKFLFYVTVDKYMLKANSFMDDEPNDKNRM